MSAPSRAVVAAADVSLPAGHPLRRAGWAAGAVGVVALAVLFAAGGADAWGAYLVAWLYGVTLALGGLFFVLAQLASRAGWSVVVRRLAEHVAGTLPLFALLAVPLAVGAGHLFPWWGHAASDPHLAAKARYLVPGFVLARLAVYAVVWALLGWWFRHRSLAQDASGDPEATRRLQSASAPALVVFAVTLTFASFDWIMSLEARWYSTVFGVYVFSGAAVGILALLPLLAAALVGGRRRPGPLAGLVTAEHDHDLGKLLFGFVVFWAYIAFSQFMLIWYGNLPEETVWYAERLVPGWRTVTILLALGHFVLPFFFLLPRVTKRRRGLLLPAAVWLLAMHWLDLYWLVMPALRPADATPRWVDLVALVGVGRAGRRRPRPGAGPAGPGAGARPAARRVAVLREHVAPNLAT